MAILLTAQGARGGGSHGRSAATHTAPSPADGAAQAPGPAAKDGSSAKASLASADSGNMNWCRVQHVDCFGAAAIVLFCGFAGPRRCLQAPRGGW